MTDIEGVAGRLMNVDEAIPSEFFIFVNQLHPITCHNFNLSGRFVSAGIATAGESEENVRRYLAGELDFVPYYPRQLQVAVSPFLVSATAGYSLEYDADYWRVAVNRLYPSRLSAIYAFGDYASCEAANAKYGWPLHEVRRFQLLPSPLNRVVKVNMEVVSVMRHAMAVGMISHDTRETVWRHYWGAGGEFRMEVPGPNFQRVTLSSGVIWEYLIEGAVEVIKD